MALAIYRAVSANRLYRPQIQIAATGKRSFAGQMDEQQQDHIGCLVGLNKSRAQRLALRTSDKQLPENSMIEPHRLQTDIGQQIAHGKTAAPIDDDGHFGGELFMQRQRSSLCESIRNGAAIGDFPIVPTGKR